MQCLNLCDVHKPCPLLREETMPALHVINLRFCLCTSLVLRQMIVVFGLGMRLYVHVHTKLENGVLHNGQQLLSTRVNLRLSRHWGLGKLCAVMSICFVLKSVSAWTVFELSLFEQNSEERKEGRKEGRKKERNPGSFCESNLAEAGFEII